MSNNNSHKSINKLDTKERKTKVSLKTTATDSDNRHYKFNIEFYVFADAGQQIAYCPALDLSSSGATFNEAISAFYECFQLYIETCVENGTLLDDLAAHGWKTTRHTLRAPAFTTLLKKPELKHLVNSGIGFEKIVAPAQIAFA